MPASEGDNRSSMGGQSVDGRTGGIRRERQDGREGPDMYHGICGARQEEIRGGINHEDGDGLEVGCRGGDQATGAYLLHLSETLEMT